MLLPQVSDLRFFCDSCEARVTVEAEAADAGGRLAVVRRWTLRGVTDYEAGRTVVTTVVVVIDQGVSARRSSVDICGSLSASICGWSAHLRSETRPKTASTRSAISDKMKFNVTKSVSFVSFCERRVSMNFYMDCIYQNVSYFANVLNASNFVSVKQKMNRLRREYP